MRRHIASSAKHLSVSHTAERTTCADTGHNKAVESTKKTTGLEAFGFGECRVAKAARDK